jgi:Uma2 family endonuclease
MRDPNAPDATYEDLKKVPDHLIGQIVEGVLITMPRPAIGHVRVATELSGELHGPFGRGRGGPGGWTFLVEPEIHFRRNILVPDIAGWRRERMPGPPPADTAFLTLAPDWVCEVLSPRTERKDRGAKLRIYRRERVGHLWFVNPTERTLEVYRLSGDLYAHVETFEDDAVVRAEPFDAVALALASLWSI